MFAKLSKRFPNVLKRSTKYLKRRPASPKRASVRPGVETLEDRMVLTIVFNPVFGSETVSGTNDGTQHPPVYLIFSGSYWSTAQGQTDEATLTNSAKNILSGPYLKGLTQYGSDGIANFAGTWQDNATVPSQPPTGTLQNFLQNEITSHGALPGINDWQHAPIYIVVSDPTSSAQYNGGYNAGGTYLQNFGFFHIPENIQMI
jgi:hypothetical protein